MGRSPDLKRPLPGSLLSKPVQRVATPSTKNLTIPDGDPYTGDVNTVHLTHDAFAIILHAARNV